MCACLRTNTARTRAHANTRMHEHLRKALRRVCTSSDAVTGTLSLAEPGHKNKRACMHTQIRLLKTNRGRQTLPPVTQVSECWPSFSFFFLRSLRAINFAYGSTKPVPGLFISALRIIVPRVYREAELREIFQERKKDQKRS